MEPNTKVHHRVLTQRDIFQKGDKIYDVEGGRFVTIRKEWIGEYYDPGHTPAIRPFYLPEDQLPKDLDPDEKPVKKFNFRERKEECDVLILLPAGIQELTFMPDKMSPSKDYCQVRFAMQEAKSRWVWLKTDDLDAGALEIL